MGAATDAERKTVIARSPIGNKYDDDLDKDSAFETLQKRQQIIEEQKQKAEKALEDEKQFRAKEKANKKTSTRRTKDTVWEAAGKTVARRFGTKIINAVWKSLFGGRR
jgi:hypothetical protein